MTPANSKKTEKSTAHSVTLEDALRLAHGHHTEGNFVLAERTYRDILKTVPEHQPTTHLLGTLLYQTGNNAEAKALLKETVESTPDDGFAWNNYGGVLLKTDGHDAALECFERAIELLPNYIDALNNKSFTLWMKGDFEQGLSCAETALKHKPKHIEAAINKGIHLGSLNRHQEAIKVWEELSARDPENHRVWCNWSMDMLAIHNTKKAIEYAEKSISIDPEYATAYNNLGCALRAQARSAEAEVQFKTATDLRPDYYQAHNNLAISLIDQYKYKDAAIAARYALAFKDDYVDASISLCVASHNLGDYQKAHIAALKSIYMAPDEAEPYLDLAEVLYKSDRLDDGEAALNEALKRKPDLEQAFVKLARIKERLDDIDSAIEAIDRAISLSPDKALNYVFKAQIYQITNQVEPALDAIEKALKLAPNFAEAHATKGDVLTSLNRTEEAQACLKKALEINPLYPGPYYTLVQLGNITSEDDPLFAQMKVIEQSAESSGLEAAATIYFAIAMALEKMKNYDSAFEYFKKANSKKRQAAFYDGKSRPPTFIGRKKELPQPLMESCKGKGCRSDLPVFIVGMPRSGTTLTEQILSSHPDVFGAGELPETNRLKRIFGLLTPENAADQGKQYIEWVKARDESGTAKRITDKMPGNFLQIGLIKSILPDAKIIHCRRSPMDTGLSCYKQNFHTGQYWSYDLEELGLEYKRYLDIMEYWRTLFPDGFLEIDYEETVSDLENVARRMIDYIDLDWNDACLMPHKQKRSIMTASRGQVTKPVYTSSVEKWKRYERQLQPLVDALK